MTMKSVYQVTCEKKVKYARWHYADKAAMGINRRNHRKKGFKPQHPYRCFVCRLWHLTSSQGR